MPLSAAGSISGPARSLLNSSNCGFEEIGIVAASIFAGVDTFPALIRSWPARLQVADQSVFSFSNDADKPLLVRDVITNPEDGNISVR